MDKQKGWLIEALVALGSALADSVSEAQKETEEEVSSSETKIKEVDEILQEIQKWTDLNDSKVEA